jgi:DNA-binding NtrC family response regulator
MAEIKAMIAGKHPGPTSASLTLPVGNPVRVDPEQPASFQTLEAMETEAIVRALDTFHGNRRQAAQALGISERTLYRKMKENGLDR